MADDPSLREYFADGLWIGKWFVDPMVNRVRSEDADEPVQLEPKVMEVLLCLAKKPGKTVTKDEFKDEVWTETVVTDDVLSRCISQLRKVFDDDPTDPSYIETIRKTGYRLVAPVERPNQSESQAHPIGATEAPGDVFDRMRDVFSNVGVDTASAEAIVSKASRRKWLVAGAGIVGVVFTVVLLTWALGPSTQGSAPVSAVPFTSFAGEEFEPEFSPRGHQVAFAWRQPDSLDQNIYLMQRGAQEPLRLSPDSTIDSSPTWSSDGRFLAYIQDDDGIHRIVIVPSIGGSPRRALSLSDRKLQGVAWLPTSTQETLVVSAERAPHRAFGLSLLYPSTDSVAYLTSPPLWSTGDMHPTPSPDGSRIAFVRGTVQGVEDVFVMPTSGGPPEQVTQDSTSIDGIAWTEDGSEIVYAAERSGVTGLWRIDAEGGDPTLIRSASEGTRFTHPTVSPRSNRLAYTQKSEQLDIWKLTQPGRVTRFTAKPLLSSTRRDVSPSIGPDGKRIAFVSDRSGTHEIWLADADGSDPSRLTSLSGPTIHAVRWSPTGKRLCFVARRNGQSDLYLISASGGRPSQLTDTPAEDLVPRWSRDGTKIYFSSNRTGNWEAWRTPATPDSTHMVQVTDGGAVAIQESRTDSSLYYVRPDTVGIWTIPLKPSRFPLSTEPYSANLPLQVINQFEPRERRSWAVGEAGIHFVYRRSNRAVLASFNFSSRRILPLYSFPDWRPVQSIATSPTGDWFAYTHVLRRESDVMLVERFR